MSPDFSSEISMTTHAVVAGTLLLIVLAGIILDWRAASKNRK